MTGSGVVLNKRLILLHTSLWQPFGNNHIHRFDMRGWEIFVWMEAKTIKVKWYLGKSTFKSIPWKCNFPMIGSVAFQLPRLFVGWLVSIQEHTIIFISSQSNCKKNPDHVRGPRDKKVFDDCLSIILESSF